MNPFASVIARPHVCEGHPLWPRAAVAGSVAGLFSLWLWDIWLGSVLALRHCVAMNIFSIGSYTFPINVMQGVLLVIVLEVVIWNASVQWLSEIIKRSSQTVLLPTLPSAGTVRPNSFKSSPAPDVVVFLIRAILVGMPWLLLRFRFTLF